ACEAIHVERHLLRECVGCQDQIMAAFGGFNLIEFKTEKTFDVTRLVLPRKRLAGLEDQLFLVFTGIKRKASEVVAKQLKKVEVNTDTLCAMHKMVYEAHEILTSLRPLEEFGQLLHRAWAAKRSLDAGISSSEIDSLYERGRQNGAIGGKLL